MSGTQRESVTVLWGTLLSASWPSLLPSCRRFPVRPVHPAVTLWNDLVLPSVITSIQHLYNALQANPFGCPSRHLEVQCHHLASTTSGPHPPGCYAQAKLHNTFSYQHSPAIQRSATRECPDEAGPLLPAPCPRALVKSVLSENPRSVCGRPSAPPIS